MSSRARLIGLGVSTALVSGALVATTPAPANAAGSSVSYSCVRPAVTDPVLGLTLLPAVSSTVPLQVDGLLEQVTVPLGGTLQQVTGTLGLTGLLTAIGGALGQLLGTEEGLLFTLDGVTKQGSLSPTGELTIPGFELPTREGSFPLTAPRQFVMKTVGGLLGTVTCTLDSVDAAVTTLLVQAPESAGRGPVVGGPGGAGSGTVAVDPTTANPCVTTPAAKPGQKATRLAAKAKKRSWTRKPAVALTVKSRKKPARGTVVACYGAMKIGQAKLKKGRATLRTVRFYPGKYRFKLVYLGSAKARPKAKAVTVRVKR